MIDSRTAMGQETKKGRASRVSVAAEQAEATAARVLPPGWQLVPLGDVARLQPGYAFDSKTYVLEGIRLLRGINIIPGRTRWDDCACLPPEEGERYQEYVLNAGDVVLAMDRPIVSSGLKVCVLSNEDLPALLLQRVGRFRISRALSSEYLYLFINSDLFLLYVGRQATGTQLPHISANDVESVRIPVPPIAEQRRIVAKIEELTDRSRRAREALDAVPAILDRFRQSVLAAAFRGDLTEEWRAMNPEVEPASVLLEQIRQDRRRKWEEDLRAKRKDPSKATYEEPLAPDTDVLPALPDGWCWATVDELAVLTQYGSSAKTNDDPAGVPVLRMGNIVDGTLILEGLKYLPADHEEFPELFLEAGDILFNRTNSPELVGKTAVFEGAPGPVSFASYLIRVRVRGCLPQLVSLYINSPFGRAWVADNVNQQVGQANLNGSKLRALAVPVPPLEEQHRIVDVVESTLSSRNRVRELADSTLAALMSLNQSILAKAFRGELVPQDPSDEPASVLLDRIRDERAETVVPKARRGRKARELAEAKG